MTTVALDEVTVSYLAELEKAMMQAQQQAALPFALQMQTAVQLFIRQHKLEGEYRLVPDGKSITRVDAPAPEPNIAQQNGRKRK